LRRHDRFPVTLGVHPGKLHPRKAAVPHVGHGLRADAEVGGNPLRALAINEPPQDQHVLGSQPLHFILAVIGSKSAHFRPYLRVLCV